MCFTSQFRYLSLLWWLLTVLNLNREFFDEVKSNEELKTKFLGAVSQKSLFLKIMDRVSDTSFATENYCMKGHSLKSLLVQRLFNCFAKNLVKKLSVQVQNCQQPPKKRKIAKLTRETHC